MRFSVYDGYNKIFWGIFIATFNIKLGIIKILPSFIGFMVISSGISSLYRNTNIEAFKKARGFAIITIILTVIGEFRAFSSIEEMNFFVLNEFIIVFNAVMEMLMFYKCIEGSIRYLNINNHADLAEINIKKLRFYVIVSIINIILLNFTLVFNITFLSFITGIVLIILRIYLMVLIREVRNIFVE